MKIFIIGSSHAGIACARRCKEEYPDAQIVLFEKKSDISFISQSIPLYLMGKNDILKNSSYVTANDLREEGIDVRVETVVTSVDTENKVVSFTNAASKDVQTENYDKLVMASGSYPVVPPLESEANGNLYSIKNMEDAISLSKFLETAKKIVVIGGGLIGIELAMIFRSRGIDVSLLQAHDCILNKYVDYDVAKDMENTMASMGIKIELNCLAMDVQEEMVGGPFKKHKQVVVHTNDNQKFDADGVVIAVGFRPNSYLVSGQVTLGDMGAIEVDEYMQTSVPDVFAVGDCATTFVNRLNKKMYLPHASDAIREGELAAVNLASPVQAINSSQEAYNMNLDKMTICVAGLTKRQADEEGYDAETVHYENPYLNSDEYVKMWLVFERGTHRILGVQVKGTAVGISSYANIISLAIEQNLTVEDIEFTDFYFEHGYKDPRGFTKILAKLVRQKDGKQKPVQE